MPDHIGTRQEKIWALLIGERVSKLIEKKGYASINAFFEERLIGEISRPLLYRIIDGTVNAKFITLKRIAQGLDITHTELLDIEGPEL